jgi:hypothetical protein
VGGRGNEGTRGVLSLFSMPIINTNKNRAETNFTFYKMGCSRPVMLISRQNVGRLPPPSKFAKAKDDGREC